MSDAEVMHALDVDGAVPDLAETIAHSPRTRIGAPRSASTETEQRLLALDRESHATPGGLELGRTIGEGGMGLVRLATQRSLGRTVAVKTVRPEVSDDAATVGLLREAWVMGSLEHPNILPVYELGHDAAGRPIIVLKRIDGVEWGELIGSEALARERYGDVDLLEQHLRILVQLCHAVSLAHARGVIHRDLKPENVMIGSFGEVYLVDWGLAVSLRPDAQERLPLAADQVGFAGTPNYMAPEMLGGRGPLGERTDVYLLGAVLHEILTKRPPHLGTFREVVGSILRSSFTYGAEIPAELGDIARRAMSPLPDARFASAEELRLRLEWYLRHRSSLAISAEATARLDQLETLLARGAVADLEHDRLYGLFAECRFGFRQALRESPDNETARGGLARTIEKVVDFELARGAPQAAASALAELSEPAAEMRARVRAALETSAADNRQLHQLRADLDPKVGSSTRTLIAAVLGVAWSITPQILGRISKESDPIGLTYLASGVGLSIGALVVFASRRSLFRTALNRRMIAALAVAGAGQLALQVGGHLLGLPKVASESLVLLVWGLASTFVVNVEPRAWAAVGGFFVAFLVACQWPERRWDAMSLSILLLSAVYLPVWRRPSEASPRDRR